jgi:hypothetical protein
MLMSWTFPIMIPIKIKIMVKVKCMVEIPIAILIDDIWDWPIMLKIGML